MVTAAQIRKIMPRADKTLVAVIVDNWHIAEAEGIRSRRAVAAWFANVGTETGGLRSIVENLNYSAKRLTEVWPKRFKTLASTKGYAGNPKALAAFVYGSRKELGNRGGDDGWNYRGTGMMQTTGRANFEAIGKRLGLDLVANPELLRDPLVAFKSAVLEFVRRGCVALADADRLTDVRKKINGGTNGLAECRAYYTKALAVFADLPLAAGAPVAAPPARASEPTLVEHPAVIDLAPATTTAPEQPEPVDRDLVELAQKLLRSKGYVDVGKPDGIVGERTTNAILAFENNNGLPLTGAVTTDLIGALAVAPMRPVAEARANATEADLKGAPAIDLGRIVRTGGLVSGVGGMLAGATDGALSLDGALDTANKLSALKDVVVGMGPWVLLGLGGIAAYFIGKRIVADQVAKYRTGNHF